MTHHCPTPLEQLFEAATGKRALTVGVPAARGPERRFPLTPEGAALLVQREMDVRVERGAGEAIHYTDTRYLQAGARMVSRAEAWGCDIVICLSALDVIDASQMRRGALLLTLQGSALESAAAMRVLLDRHVIVLALDLVCDSDGHRPFADILNEIDGRAAMAVGAALLADAEHGKGILLGGVAGVVPCEVTVIGAGIGGMAAARSAIGMGATVRIFDTDVYRLRVAQDILGAGVIASSIHPRVIVNALRTADVVVASQTAVPHAVDSDVVATMKQGVVTFALETYGAPTALTAVFPSMPQVDLAQDSRLRRDLDDRGPRQCYVNALGTVPRTVAMALSNTLTNMFADIVSCGGGMSNTLKLHPGMQRAVFTYMGKPVSADLARVLGMRPVEISLLLSFS